MCSVSHSKLTFVMMSKTVWPWFDQVKEELTGDVHLQLLFDFKV